MYYSNTLICVVMSFMLLIRVFVFEQGLKEILHLIVIVSLSFIAAILITKKNDFRLFKFFALIYPLTWQIYRLIHSGGPFSVEALWFFPILFALFIAFSFKTAFIYYITFNFGLLYFTLFSGSANYALPDLISRNIVFLVVSSFSLFIISFYHHMAIQLYESKNLTSDMHSPKHGDAGV